MESDRHLGLAAMNTGTLPSDVPVPYSLDQVCRMYPDKGPDCYFAQAIEHSPRTRIGLELAMLEMKFVMCFVIGNLDCISALKRPIRGRAVGKWSKLRMRIGYN